MPETLPGTNGRLVVDADEFRRLATSDDGRSPVDPSDRICTRFVVRLVPWPLASATPRPLDGGVLVVGRSKVAETVCGRLVNAGVAATLVETPPRGEAVGPILPDNAQPPRHLLLLAALDEDRVDGVQGDWPAQRQAAIDLPYFLIQRWYAQNEQAGLDGCTLIGVTSLGTAGGLADGLTRPVDGALTGLVKGIAAEQRADGAPGFRAAVIDLPGRMSAAAIAEAVLAELTSDDGNVEIVYRDGQRYSPRPINLPLGESHGDGRAPASAGPWVITGGARGVTAEVARGFAGRPGAKLHLIGSSPAPEVPQQWLSLDPQQRRQCREQVVRAALARHELPAEAWAKAEKGIEIARTLRGLAQLGIEATYHSCDVGDSGALDQLLRSIRRRDGGIVGVIHGAGFEKASRFSRKKPELVRRTLRAKLDGAVALMQLTAKDPLHCFLAFGSISGRFGAVGQTDYCMANECLAKLIRWYRGHRPGVAATVFAWHSWDQVGMAVRPESKFSKSLQRLRFMPPDEGVDHLFAELADGCSEPEVVITDWRYFKLRHPDPLLLPPPVERCSRREPPVVEAETVELPAEGDAVALHQPAEVASRFVLRMRPAPRAAGPFTPPPGPVLILGDNDDARAVQLRLQSLGVAVDRLAVDGDAQAVVAETQRLLDAGRATSLLLATAHDTLTGDLTDPAVWSGRRHAGVIAPYLVVQRWFAHHVGRRPDAVLLGSVALGGDFGFASTVPSPEGGAVCGLLKTVRLEAARRGWTALRVRVVDAAGPVSADVFAQRLLEEAAAGGDIEVGYDAQGRRHVVQLQRQAAEAAAAELPPRGSVWVAIGGGRGITAKLAYHLAASYGVKMHLVGSGPPPDLPPGWCDLDDQGRAALKRSIAAEAIAAGESPAARWGAIERRFEVAATLRTFADAGLPVMYHQCDASDRAALSAVLAAIRRVDGPIHAVLQGAGKFQPGRFEHKSHGQLQEMVRAKLDATLAVLALTAGDPLGWFIGFGSIGGRFGTNGNTDYAMAADMQCKLAGWLRHWRPEVRAVGVHWHAWDEVGMMMHSASFGSRKLMKLALMPPAEGARHLDRELRAGLPEAEVVITDDSYHRSLPPVAAERASAGGTAVSAPLLPLIDAVSDYQRGQRLVAHCRLSGTSDPFLQQHRYRGQPLLPFAVALELMAEAAARFAPDGEVIGLRDVEFLSGVKVLGQRPLELRARLVDAGRQGGQQRVSVALVSDFVDRRGQVLQSDRLHARGTVVLGSRPSWGPELPQTDLPWLGFPYPRQREAVLWHGPIFRRHRGFRGDPQRGWARIVPGPLDQLAGRRGDQGWLLPPDVIDACLLSCGIHTWLFRPRTLALPQSLASLAWSRVPLAGEVCLQRLDLRLRGQDRWVYDFQLCDQHGLPIVRGEGLASTFVNMPRT